jgi:LmbE family N-acetylglucosaminyl deacetylase
LEFPIMVNEVPATAERIVVFSPHPDDDVIACGGTIIKKVGQGAHVEIVYSTDGSMSHSAVLGIDADPTPEELVLIRAKEAEAAAQRMGVDPRDVHFLGFRDTELRASLPEFRAAVTAFLAARPDVTEVYLPHEVREMNADHRLTGAGVLECLAATGLSPRIRKFVIWDERTEAEFVFVNREPTTAPVATGERQVTEDISAQLDGKLAALREHATQVSLYSAAQTRPVVPEAFVQRMCTRDTEHFWTASE